MIAINMIMAGASGGMLAIMIAVWAQVSLEVTHVLLEYYLDDKLVKLLFSAIQNKYLEQVLPECVYIPEDTFFFYLHQLG